MAFDTAGNIVADAAVELGLVAFNNRPTSPFTSTDPNIGRLCQLLKPLGRELIRKSQWNNIRQTWLFQTVTNTGAYGFPGDYDRFIDQTAWNRTNRLPLGGPVSPQEFEFFKARLVGVVFNILFQTLQGQFTAYPDDVTPGGYTIAFEYMSRFWVVPQATAATSGPWRPNSPYLSSQVVNSGGNLYTCTTPGTSGIATSLAGTGSGITDGTAVWNYVSVAGQDAPTQSTDVLQFDPQLLTRMLKRDFLRATGFPSDAAEQDAREALEHAITADKVSPVLHFARGTFSEPLLGERNIPLTGFGGH